MDLKGATTGRKYAAVQLVSQQATQPPSASAANLPAGGAAEAVYWAAHHRRREIIVGGSAIKAIVGNKLAPRFADWYLARTDNASQQITTMPIDPDRPNNLFEPVPNLAATHGMFDDQAKSKSYQLWATTHRPLVAGTIVGPSSDHLGSRRRTR